MPEIVIFPDSPLGQYLADLQLEETAIDEADISDTQNSLSSSLVERADEIIDWLSSQFRVDVDKLALEYEYSAFCIKTCRYLTKFYLKSSSITNGYMDSIMAALLSSLIAWKVPRTHASLLVPTAIVGGAYTKARIMSLVMRVHLKSLNDASKQFLRTHRKLIRAVQEIELVARGFSISPDKSYPPISRIELTSLATIKAKKTREFLVESFKVVIETVGSFLKELSGCDYRDDNAGRVSTDNSELSLVCLKERSDLCKRLLSLLSGEVLRVFKESDNCSIMDCLDMISSVTDLLETSAKDAAKYDPLKIAMVTLDETNKDQDETVHEHEKYKRFRDWVLNYESLRKQHAVILESIETGDEECVERMFGRLTADMWLLRNDLDIVIADIKEVDMKLELEKVTKLDLADTIDLEVGGEHSFLNESSDEDETAEKVYEAENSPEKIKMTREERIKLAKQQRILHEQHLRDKREKFEFDNQLRSELENVIVNRKLVLR